MNKETLNCIAVSKRAHENIAALQKEISQWAGRPIKVVALDALREETEKRSKEEGIRVPAHWFAEASS